MRILFKKESDKPSILTCIREDGSKTWVKMYPGIEAHDLGHYVVESVLGFEDAFYGMIVKGSAIEDFELPRENRPAAVLPQNLSHEALITEHLVNLLMTKAQNDNSEFAIVPSLRSILKEKRLPFPKNLTERKMDMIWNLFQKLLGQWKALPKGKILELDFS